MGLLLKYSVSYIGRLIKLRTLLAWHDYSKSTMAFSYTNIIENDHRLASHFWVGSLEKSKKKEFMGEINLIGLT